VREAVFLAGLLIDFEGIDFSGKGTQVALLEKGLPGLTAASLHFPVLETRTGRVIEDFLAGRVHLAPDVLQMLYSANRYELKERVLALSREVDVLILDRWCPSGWAYGMALGLEEAWLRNLDAGLPQAGLTILLDLSPEAAAARRGAAGQDVLERDPAFQERVRRAYAHLAAAGGWAVVDALGKARDVHEKVLAQVRNLVSRQGKP